MATIKAILKKKSKTSTIYIRLRSGKSHDYTIKTSFTVDSNLWNKNTNRPKETSAELKVLKNDLDDLCYAIQQSLNNISKEGLEPSKIWLENVFNKFTNKESKSQNAEITYWIQYIIDNPFLFDNSIGEKGLSSNRLKHYKTLKNIIETYQNKQRLKIIQINQTFYDKFFYWLTKKQLYYHNTAKKLADDIISVAKHTMKYEIPTSSDLQIIKRVKDRKTTPIILEVLEIEKIKKLILTQPYLINARKWLLLGLQLAQRVSDILPLNESNIHYVNNLKGELVKCLVFTQKKSQGTKEMIVPIDTEIEAIIKDGFPHKITPQRFNEYIKELCRVAEIDKPTFGALIQVVEVDGIKKKRKIEGVYPKWQLITSHTMRKTATTHLYQVFGAKVKHITGHSKEETVNIYVNEDRSRKLSQVQQMRKEYQDLKKPVIREPKLEIVKKTSNN